MRRTGVPIIDRVIGGIAPGLPLVLAGPAGCGRTVLALQLAAAALRAREIVIVLTGEPAPLLLSQATTLGVDLEGAVRSEQLILLEIDPRASASLAGAGGAAFGEAILAEHPSASLIVVDPFTAFTRSLLDEAPLRAAARELVSATPHSSLVLTVETDRGGVGAPVERVLSEVCGALLMLERGDDGRRTLRVAKTRAGAGAAEALEFAIGAQGAELVRDLPGGRARTAAAPPQPAATARVAGDVAPAAPVAPPADDPGLPADEAVPRRRRVLVVDEDEASLSRMRAWLETDWEVTTAGDGFEALTVLLGEKPDLVVLDMELSRVTGREVLNALHRAAQRLPILALTGPVDRQGQRLAPLALGAADLLAKPVQPFELRHKVGLLLRLDGPPTRTLEVEQARELFAVSSRTRLIPAADFRARLDRVCAFGESVGVPSTLLALDAPSSECFDHALAAADELLRFEDSLLRISKRRGVLLLVAADPSDADAVVSRLAERLVDEGRARHGLRWRAHEARPAAEIGDWRALFRDLDDLGTQSADGDAS